VRNEYAYRVASRRGEREVISSMVQETGSCKHCGAALADGARFCAACGGPTSLDNDEPRISPAAVGLVGDGRREPAGSSRSASPVVYGVVALMILGAVAAAFAISGRLGGAAPPSVPPAAAAIGPSPTSTIGPSARASLAPSPAPSAPATAGRWPDGFDVAYCAAYGNYNSSVSSVGANLEDDFASYTAGAMSSAQVVRAIASYDSDFKSLDAQYGKLPAWSPAKLAVSQFRSSIAAYRKALGYFSAGMKNGSQKQFDQGTAALSAISDPMTNAYGNVKALFDKYGLACSPEGFSLSLSPPGGTSQPPTTATSGIGKAVVAGDVTIVVEKVEQWPGAEFIQPGTGNVYLTVFMAVTPSKATFANLIQTRVQATDGTSYDVGFFGSREPSLPAGTLTPKVTVKGWITFEVPRGLADQMTLMYPTSLTTPPVAIALY
jgi:hypothetical protein